MKFSFSLLKIFFLSIPVILCSCHSYQKEKFIILPNPIYSEIDTFRNTLNNLERNKIDYFIVKGNLRNKSQVISSIDSFVNNIGKSNSKGYDNYIMYFYHMTPEVNLEELKKYKDQKYEMFELNQQDRIISFSFYESKLLGKVVNQ